MSPRPPGGATARATALAGGAAVAAVAGALVTHPAGLRFAFLAGLVVLIAGFCVLAPRYLLFGLAVWVAELGLIRRLVSAPTQGNKLDPLLLVVPLALTVLAVVVADRGAFRRDSPLSKAVAVISVLMVVGAFNPLQGGLQTGVAGLLFTLVPMLAFWVGRGLCDDRTLARLLQLIGVLALGAAGYGLVQTFSRFPSWDAAWIRTSGYNALNVGGTIRAFGSSSSAQEYALFIAVGIAVWLMFGVGGKRAPFVVAVVGVLAVALFYESSRSAVVSLVLALGVAISARRRLPLALGALVGALFLGGLFVVASHLSATGLHPSGAAALAAHQVMGLADPLNPASSTLVGHLTLSGEGLRSVLTYPLGRGTGTVSIAAGKFGGIAAGTELDFSNVAVALGLPGLGCYLVVLVLGLSQAYRLVTRRRDALSAAALCLLVVTLFQWFNGGLYSVAFLAWLVLGWVDRASHAETAMPAAARPVAESAAGEVA